MQLTSSKEKIDECFQRSDLLYNIVLALPFLPFCLFSSFLVLLPLPIGFFLFSFVYCSPQLLAPLLTFLCPNYILRSPGASRQAASNLFICFCCCRNYLCCAGISSGGDCSGGDCSSRDCLDRLHVLFLRWAFCWAKISISCSEIVLATLLTS